jgi:hypothetical protein
LTTPAAWVACTCKHPSIAVDPKLKSLGMHSI